MGQARRRGSFEERKLQAEHSAEVEKAERCQRAAEAEAAMTPGERARRTKARMLLAAMVGITKGYV